MAGTAGSASPSAAAAARSTTRGPTRPTSILSDLYLSRGFAYANSTELVNQQHCNQVLQGETLMMLKEHFIEAYGVPKWTVGTGGSGGSIQQMVITQMYPGLLDGLQPSLSFPDSSMQTADCGLLQNFWKTAAGKKWSQEKKTAVDGLCAGTCASWERSFVRTIQAAFADGCALNDKSLIYDPKKNKKGVRCTTQEMRVNIYGKDPKTGFARRPIDNVGIQYGLNALNDGKITVDEFLQVNEKVGGNDPDGGFGPKRTVGDPAAIKAIYASGLFNTFKNLDTCRCCTIAATPTTRRPGDIHDRHRDLTIRARLEKATGASDNQVIWVADRRAGERGNAGDGEPCADRARHHDQVARCDGGRSRAAEPRQGRQEQAGGCDRRLLDAGWQAREREGELGSLDVLEQDLSAAHRTAHRRRRAGRQRHHEVPAQAGRHGRLQGEVLQGAADAAEEDLQGRRVRLVEAQRRIFLHQGNVSAVLIVLTILR